MGAGQASGDQSQLAGRERVRELANAEDRQNLSSAVRSGMGICRARGNDYSLLVGPEYWFTAGELPRMQQWRGLPDSACGLVSAEPIRPLRHVRQRGRMGGGLLERQLSRRSQGRLRLDHGSVPAPGTARRSI